MTRIPPNFLKIEKIENYIFKFTCMYQLVKCSGPSATENVVVMPWCRGRIQLSIIIKPLAHNVAQKLAFGQKGFWAQPERRRREAPPSPEGEDGGDR